MFERVSMLKICHFPFVVPLTILEMTWFALDSLYSLIKLNEVLEA